METDLETTKTGLETTRTELAASKTDVTVTKADLATTKTELAASKTDLNATKTDLASTKADLVTTKTDLATTKTDLTKMKTDLETTKTDLAASKTSLNATKTDLASTKTDLATTKADLATVKTNLAATSNDLKVTKSTLDLTATQVSKNQADMQTLNSSIVAITPPKPVPGAMPTSCADYKTMGHSQSGFYLVKGSSTQVKTLYCDFSKAIGTTGFETRIGYNDVKSSSNGVYFHVQKSSSYSTAGSVIPFEVETLNVGGGMNTKTGIFIAPVDGIYYFSFSGVKPDNTQNLWISLQLNNVNIGTAYTGEQSSPFNSLIISLQSTLALKKGDEIKLNLNVGTLYDNTNHHTEFSGWLIQEDLTLQ